MQLSGLRFHMGSRPCLYSLWRGDCRPPLCLVLFHFLLFLFYYLLFIIYCFCDLGNFCLWMYDWNFTSFLLEKWTEGPSLWVKTLGAICLNWKPIELFDKSPKHNKKFLTLTILHLWDLLGGHNLLTYLRGRSIRISSFMGHLTIARLSQKMLPMPWATNEECWTTVSIIFLWHVFKVTCKDAYGEITTRVLILGYDESGCFGLLVSWVLSSVNWSKWFLIVLVLISLHEPAKGNVHYVYTSTWLKYSNSPGLRLKAFHG